MRILHVVGGMNRGGLETWLMHVLRHTDRQRFRLDFLVHTTRPCEYDAEIRALGSEIRSCLTPARPWLYARNFRRILRAYGPYDIVHSHVHHYSGYVLRLAWRSGVPVRIAHSHSDTSALEARATCGRSFYLALMKRWIARYATAGMAGCRQAAAALFGPNWGRDPRWRIVHYGIDLVPFRVPVDASALRARLGIPSGAFVIGHVGRFDEEKNHAFLVDVAAETVRRDGRARLLLVGDGRLRPLIEQQVARLGLAQRVVFTGVRPDVPRLMRGGMDVLVMPSTREGLPLVAIEAQAAGLPVILSDVVTEEADVAKPLIRRLSLSEPVSAWAQAILATPSAGAAIAQGDALSIMERSPFNIQNTTPEMLYRA